MSLLLLAMLLACSGEGNATTTSVPPPASTTSTSPVTSTSGGSSTSSTAVTTTTIAAFESLVYEQVADLPFPVQMTALPGSEISYVVTKDGRIWAYDGAGVAEQPVLDISDRVRNSGEQGLLSMALDPEDEGHFFLHYSASDGDTVVAEYRFDDEMTADPGSERVLLRLDQPAPNHNGGLITFGPDGRLYLGLGDGGGGGDTYDNGQNRDTLLGGIVVMSPSGEANPELFAYGLRNPWRFWFDSDLMYVADVGQNAYEEISVTPIEPDLNFGWPIIEGTHCFRPSSGCETGDLVMPVVEVQHGDAGTCSITGGFVYRGAAIPEIEGHYFYSDYCGGYLRSFRYEGGVIDETDWTGQVGVPGDVVGFGVDGAGEMYVATTNALFRVVAVRAG